METRLKQCPTCKGRGHILPVLPHNKYPTMDDWIKCYVCGGLGTAATVDQFTDAYKLH